MAELVELIAESDARSIAWSAGGLPAALKPSRVFIQPAESGLEVAIASATKRPTANDMRKAWKERQCGRSCPVLLLAMYYEAGQAQVAVCGPVGDEPPVLHGLEVSQVARLSRAALAEPTRHAATRFLLTTLPEADNELPGLRNQGLLATQELRAGVPQRHDWADAGARGRPLLGRRGRGLVEGLGYTIEALAVNASLLTVKGADRAVAVFLDEGETFEGTAVRFGGTSPVSQAFALAGQKGLAWVVLTRGSEIRLYSTRPNVGVGRKGQTETFIEINLALLPEELAAYLDLLFSASALDDGGTFSDILGRSADYAAELATRLRERVYFEAVPALASAIAARLTGAKSPAVADLDLAYEQTLTILFRLLFVAYAEDKELLPYRTNSKYADHSLKRIARRLTDDVAAGTLVFDGAAGDLWEDVRQLWRAVSRGNRGWGVPAYDGRLFSDDDDLNAAGAGLAKMDLTDAELGPGLVAMLVDEGPDGVIGPVDFRSLSVREFGTIYEGLLESNLSVAPSDLTVDKAGNYVPATKRDKVVVPKGDVYFHNRSGARKATGSYFTKPFAVEHLLDHALEPALDEHLDRVSRLLESGDEAAAAASLFDFRCADISMGSGHFLVAAIDRIEARLSAFLALNPIPSVAAELERLRSAAHTALADLADGVEIEDASLLRRQVARRCIYGVDLNHISVELARLAVWIHTFVPGLPLSFLDHNLVQGNSLTGIGTIAEAVEILDPKSSTGTVSIFEAGIDGFLGRATKALRRLGTVSDATVPDIDEARKAHLEALAAVKPAHDLFDLLVAIRLGDAPPLNDIDERKVAVARTSARADELAAELNCLHFPVAFPEVFLRDRPGFDCILGNPPWEEMRFDTDKFWARFFPGHGALTTESKAAARKVYRSKRPDLADLEETERRALTATSALLKVGPDAGHDLSVSFSKRATRSLVEGGRLGLVLPFASMMGAAKGWVDWRRQLRSTGSITRACTFTNRNGWVFDDIDTRLGITLVAWRKSSALNGADDVVIIDGRFYCLNDFLNRAQVPSLVLKSADIEALTPGKGFYPAPPLHGAGDLLRAFLRFPRLADRRTDFAFSAQHDVTSAVAAALVRRSGGIGDIQIVQGADVRLFQSTRTSVRLERAHLPEGLRARVDSERTVYKKLARPDDTYSVWATRVPKGSLVKETAYAIETEGADLECEHYLLAILWSFAFNWQARCWHDYHILPSLFGQFRVPLFEASRIQLELSQAARQLATEEPTDSDVERLIARIDARSAALFGLEPNNASRLFETFHPTQKYADRRERMLSAW